MYLSYYSYFIPPQESFHIIIFIYYVMWNFSSFLACFSFYKSTDNWFEVFKSQSFLFHFLGLSSIETTIFLYSSHKKKYSKLHTFWRLIMKIKQTPLVILNFKTYLESTGEKGRDLAKALEEVSEETGISMVAAPQGADLWRLSREVEIPVLAQHIDPVDAGGHTGSMLAECAMAAGAAGTLINHSEQRMQLADIDNVVSKMNSMDMTSVVCTNNIQTSAAAAALKPDFVAIEPPELIGSGIPVSQAEPEVVEGSVAAIKDINPQVKVLCGAGISTGDDMKAALELGSEGVLLASGIILASDPKQALLDLVSKI
jgi:triosephosphate isomerase